MITRKQKEDLVGELKDKLVKTKAAVFADYTGLSVAKMTELRRKLRAAGGAELKVAKKTLIDLALKQAGLKGVDSKEMAGQIALIMGYGDEVAPAKTVYTFGKTDEHLKIIGGILGTSYITSEAVIGLAKLPSKQELLAKAVGSIAAPLSGLLNVLQGNIRGLVQILSQIKTTPIYE